MALKLEGKKAIVTEVANIAANAVLAVAANYRGLTVSQMTDLRSKARQAGLYLRVVRNTLARRAVEETEFACLQEALVGPMILLFSSEDPGVAARLMRDFAKDNKDLEVKALVMGGKLLTAEAIEAVANLPSREQAIGMLMSVMNAPVTKLVRTLAEPYAQAVRAFAAIRDQKQAA
jgi:large subunit ribosomal protein L10